MKARLGDDAEDGQLLLGGPGAPALSSGGALSIAGGATLSANPAARAATVAAIVSGSGGSSGGGTGGRGGGIGTPRRSVP